MPAFHDTWLSPNTSIPPISTGADRNHLDRSTTPSRICRLCGDGFHTENNLSHTRARSPCDDLSCTGCTWLWRNGDSACHTCAARFPCPFRAPASGSAGVDGLPSSSYRVVVPDEGYEGDDERGIIAKVGNVPSASSRLSMMKKERWAQRNRDRGLWRGCLFRERQATPRRSRHHEWQSEENAAAPTPKSWEGGVESASGEYMA